MMNLVKFDLSGFQFNLGTNLALGSAWDDSAAAGNLTASATTTRVGVGGSGSGLEIRFNTNATPAINQYTVTNHGKGYKAGDVITFSFTAADAIATGSFSITFTPVAGDGFYQGGCGQDATIKSKKGFFDADPVIGIITPAATQPSFITRARGGSSAAQNSEPLQVTFVATGMDDTDAGHYGVNKAISLCIADAKRRPNSRFDLADYLPSGVTIANYTYKV